MARRASLRDRDSAAIATSPHLPGPPADVSDAADLAPAPPATAQRAAPKAGGGVAGSDVRISLYLHPDTYHDTRAAYVADFEQPDPASSYAEWIAEAVRTHAGLRAEQRAQLADTQPVIDRAGVGIHRTVKVPANVQAVMDDARRADRLTGRAIGRSGFAYQAILAAIDTARHRAGGTLPEPPARLPKSLA